MAGQKGKSRKQLGGKKQPSSQPKDFVLFLDENLCNCQPLLDAIAECGVRYERHYAHYPPGTPDTGWLPYVGSQHWILLTADQTIRYSEVEKRAVVRHKVREFVFTSGNLSRFELARLIKIAMPSMQKLCLKQKPPFIASITKSGNVSLRYPKPASTGKF